ncbi:MAG: IS4 family transposase [Planctomycetales bacterium]|nr:IS4 family transposase [Planctomycetales bacterium]
MQSVQDWAQLNFGECELGDKRRTLRLVQVAEQFASSPSASLPNQTETWGDLKAAYRLFACKAATLEAIARPHWELTKQRAQGRTLVIGDTTEIDFGRFRKVAGAGPTGNGTGNGFLLHNALMVNAETEELLGVAGQTIHTRKAQRKPEKRPTSPQRLKKKNRESEVWGKVIDQIGPPAAGCSFVHVFDRGADNFEVYCHLLQQRGDWVIRACQSHRSILVGETDQRMQLREYLPLLKAVGSYTLQLRARPRQAAREAELEVRIGQIKIPPPRHVSPWVRKLKQGPIAMNLIEVVEVNAPKGVEPIRWVLLTSLPVVTFKDAWILIGYYELRWLVEEYHKALKTGCRTESCQLKTAGRLEAFVGMTSVVAVRLLQLKSLARTRPDVPAKQVVPNIWLRMLKLARKNLNCVHDLTVGQFYREVAKLGGFLGRKSDGDPGWITIWRGWEKLNTYVFVASRLKSG